MDENSHQYLLQKNLVAAQTEAASVVGSLLLALCLGLPKWIMWKSDYLFTHIIFCLTILIHKVCMFDLYVF